MVWKEFSFDLNCRLPFNLSKGKYSRFLAPEVQYSLKNVEGKDTLVAELYPNDNQSLSYRIFSYNLLRSSKQSLIPKWGQQLDVVYRHTLNNQQDADQLKGIQTILYFPAPGKNAGFRIYQGFQNKTVTNSYSFSNFIRMPRGYQSSYNNKMYSLLADYKIPLWYPDFSFGKLAYFKRLKSSFFYDWAWLSVPVIDENDNIIANAEEIRQQSLGIELTADMHLLRLIAPIEMGFRTIYRPEYNDFQYNFMFSINFNDL